MRKFDEHISTHSSIPIQIFSKHSIRIQNTYHLNLLGITSHFLAVTLSVSINITPSYRLTHSQLLKTMNYYSRIMKAKNEIGNGNGGSRMAHMKVNVARMRKCTSKVCIVRVCGYAFYVCTMPFALCQANSICIYDMVQMRVDHNISDNQANED